MADISATSENRIPQCHPDATSKIVTPTHSEYRRESLTIVGTFAALRKILKVYFVYLFIF